MEKKTKSIILTTVVVMSAALFIFCGCLVLSSADEGFVVHTFQTAGKDMTIKLITDEDLTRHPALKIALDTSESLIITENPFIIMRHGERCINKSEADLIQKDFGVMYREDGSSKTLYRRLLWNNTYYELLRYIS